MKTQEGQWISIRRGVAAAAVFLSCLASTTWAGPLRLAIPVKYGVKNIKRIGLIRYTNLRPSDFWAEQGYDWYAGL